MSQTTDRTAIFNHHPDGYYIPANSVANAATSVISNRFPREKHMLAIRAAGFIPMLEDGTELGKVNVTA